MRNQWWVYIIQCSDGSLYTGYTTDLVKRVAEHNSGKGAKSIKGKLPVSLVHSEVFGSGTEARKREYAIKQWSRKNKLKLIYRSGA